MPRSETFTLYKGRKEGLASTYMGHIEKEYEIVSDEIEEGIRVIKLKEKDLTERTKMQEEIVDAIMEKLGEEGKMLREILRDTMKDYGSSSIKRMYNKAVLGKVPIRKGRGCYYISIGDGRKKNSEIIRIRP